MINFNNYTSSFFKYYLPKKIKLIFVIILTILIYIWISKITNDITNSFYRYKSRVDYLTILGNYGTALYLLYIKPLFVYISRLIIIKYI
jgi:hypothetical protein